VRFWSRARQERELEQEIRFHLAEEARLRRERGEAPESASRGARRDFGNITAVRETTREMWGAGSLERLWEDGRHGLRLMRRAPGFYAAAIAALALGIGANSAIFSVVDAVLIRPLPYAEPDRLVLVWEDNAQAGFPRNTPSPAEWAEMRAQSEVFVDVAATRGASYNITGDGAPEQVVGRRVTGNFWTVLGSRPLRGRVFTEREDREGQRLAVIAYGLWQRRFGGEDGAIGRTLLLNDVPYTVTGVMPPEFSFLPSRLVEVWTPMSFTAHEEGNRAFHALNCVARLQPGVSAGQAEAAASGVARRAGADHHVRGVEVTPVREQLAGNTRLALFVLLGGSGCVLLIACVNLANLLLARGAVRKREFALRAAIGATRGRIVRQLLTESLLLSILGGTAGLALAAWTLPLLESLAPETMVVPLALNARILGFTAAAAVFCAVLFGAVHAWFGVKTALAATLQEGGRGASGQRGFRIHDALIVAETALATVLLVAAGLIVQTLYRLESVDLGLNSEGLLAISAPPHRYPEHERRDVYLNTLLERIHAVPGVISAGFTSCLPLTEKGNTGGYLLEGQAESETTLQDALFRVVTPDYLQTIGAQMREGRYFSAADRAGSLPVAVVNESFAERHFLPGRALGRRFQIGRRGPEYPWYTITGVVKEIRERGIDTDLKPGVYLTHAQARHAWPVPETLVVRTAAEPAQLVNAIRHAVRQVNKEQPVSRVQTMNQVISRELAVPRQSSVLLSLFSGLALLLAGIGIYGVLSYSVTRRSPEIGIRMALGATQGSIVLFVARRGVLLAIAGLALGFAAALPLSRIMSALLYEVPTVDLGTPVFCGLILLAVAALAAWLPARRAASLDPAVTLRHE
jgi:putative ABC transport system permease protein